MKFFKLAAIAALVGASFSASAMQTIGDEELSAVSGQDGVTIAGDLNVNIGSFQYTDTDANGGSVSFNNIGIKGLFVMTVDILNNAAFTQTVAESIGARLGLTKADATNAVTDVATKKLTGSLPAGATATDLKIAGELAKLTTASFNAFEGASTTTTGTGAAIYDGQSDVVQFAFPNAKLDSKLAPTITVGSIKLGTSSTTIDATTSKAVTTHTDNNSASFGSMAINNIDLQGTKVWIFAH